MYLLIAGIRLCIRQNIDNTELVELIASYAAADCDACYSVMKEFFRPYKLRKSCLIFPVRTEPPNQTANPICSLERLIAMTFHLDWRFY